MAEDHPHQSQKGDVALRSWGWVSLEGHGSGKYVSTIRTLRHVRSSTHCAKRPACVTVITILSANDVDVTSVIMPSITTAACLVMAGYVAGMWGTGGESGAIGRGILTR